MYPDFETLLKKTWTAMLILSYNYLLIIKNFSKSKSVYINDTWNYFDWISILLMLGKKKGVPHINTKLCGCTTIFLLTHPFET